MLRHAIRITRVADMLNDATGFDELNELERWKLSDVDALCLKRSARSRERPGADGPRKPTLRVSAACREIAASSTEAPKPAAGTAQRPRRPAPQCPCSRTSPGSPALSLPKTPSMQLMPHVDTHEVLHRVGSVVVCEGWRFGQEPRAARAVAGAGGRSRCPDAAGARCRTARTPPGRAGGGAGSRSASGPVARAGRSAPTAP